MKNLNLTVILLLLCAEILVPGNAVAKVEGKCANCHTMHNSQGGASVVPSTKALQESLLNDDCLGCHTGSNDFDNTDERTPHVYNTGSVDYGDDGTLGDTLAGGTFKYINITDPDQDTFGHNVVDLKNPEGVLFDPPGYYTIEGVGGLQAADGTIPGINRDWDGAQITCAGTYGCHGSHDTTSNTVAIRGGHHSDVAIGIDNSPAAGYRMLVGIEGIEDSDWEYMPDKNNHNQYKGGINDTSTISYLCAECHGTFHDGSNGSPWLRHPTDYVMSSPAAIATGNSDYSGTDPAYLPATPLASSSEPIALVTKIDFTNGEDSIVTCISCHRAHGSPYYKSMRWSYAKSNDGGLSSDCHTSKN